MQFVKMHGAGNDYVYVDCFAQPVPSHPAELAVAVSDRHTGVGADGLILILPSSAADARMRMFNADGSEAEMCGNGIRCVAKYVHDHGLARRNPLRIETRAGVLALDLELKSGRVERVRVDLGRPTFQRSRIPTTLLGTPPLRVPLRVARRTLEVSCVSMGNPHCVVFVEELSDKWVLGVGPRLETHAAFPARINVEFVRIVSRSEIEMRVWERGSGETRACGTGACAAVVVGVLTRLMDRTVRCRLPGGDLDVEWSETGPVFLTGPAVEVFRGEWPGAE